MIWLFGNYGRLSKDEKGEKLDSKDTQLAFNNQFINDNSMGMIVDNYFDDDISGTVFDDREDLERLKEDLINGKINAVVTKDLSRLGRTNYKTLGLIEWLQENQFRLVAINDNIDSLKGDDSYIGIKTWFNEQYVRDVSVKIRSNVHQKLKQGEYLGTPPFGYKKEYTMLNNKPKPINKLLVDELVRHIIVEIFDLYIAGHGYRNIADILQDKGYINPSKYKNYNRPQSLRWNKDHVKRIITNRVYCGDTVQGVSERISYKTKKTRKRPETQWYVTENSHEPIVSRETWELANKINQKRANENGARNKKTIYLFSGFLECGACGRFLCARVTHGHLGFICANYFHFGKKADGKVGGCTSHHVRSDLLEQVVYDDIVNQMNEANMESIFHRKLEKEKIAKDHTKTISQLQKEIDKYKRKLDIIYEDRLNDIISVEYFQTKTKDVNNNIDGLKLQVATLEKEMLADKKLELTKDKLKSTFRDVLKQKKLTRELLEKAIKKIYVYLPGDIKDEDKEVVAKKLGTDIETVIRVKQEGGIFIEYNLVSI
ncbi:recombinase family protein [Phosphitispora fastidiosa]|uniref:recombinase family protein n=1 Tax=Phosphitispora fastidiosa TaxID=2837202 RepID=UPI001E4D1148|nr:recombinase family protein [Phosphitispora fastidiosa]MBU7005617.1 DNA invertase Pin-like site-specific DNA recombinase [Phosphitispora fastidiosa]